MRHPPHILWAIGIGALAIGLMLLIGALVDHAPFAIDEAILRALRHTGDLSRPIGPGWLHETMINVTALGSGTVLTIVVAGVVVVLATRRLWFTALILICATLSGPMLVAWLKTYIARPRPVVVDHLVQVSNLSFPSGHAANSAVVYLTIAMLVSQVVSGRATRNALLVLAVLLVGAIGLTRIYLGVHFPSDVLGGWSFGSLWALAWWMAAARIRMAGAR